MQGKEKHQHQLRNPRPRKPRPLTALLRRTQRQGHRPGRRRTRPGWRAAQQRQTRGPRSRVAPAARRPRRAPQAPSQRRNHAAGASPADGLAQPERQEERPAAADPQATPPGWSGDGGGGAARGLTKPTAASVPTASAPRSSRPCPSELVLGQSWCARGHSSCAESGACLAYPAETVHCHTGDRGDLHAPAPHQSCATATRQSQSAPCSTGRASRV